MKLTKATNTVKDTVVEISDHEFKQVAAKIMAEQLDIDTAIDKSSGNEPDPALRMLLMISYGALLARLHTKLFCEEDSNGDTK